ncbi:MAG: hypothetical protein ACM3VS_09405 [Candidatus Dadabacteria bacterium]
MPKLTRQQNPYFIYAGIDHDLIADLKQQLATSDTSIDLVTCDNGLQLIKKIEEVKVNEAYPELLILTRHMKRLDGKETLQLLRSDDIYKLIPVIIFLDNDDQADSSYFMNLGADVVEVYWKDYVEKMTSTLCNWLS